MLGLYGFYTNREILARSLFDDNDDSSRDESTVSRAHHHTVAPSQVHLQTLPECRYNKTTHHLAPFETSAEARARQARQDGRGQLQAQGNQFGAVFDEARHAEVVEATKAVLVAERTQILVSKMNTAQHLPTSLETYNAEMGDACWSHGGAHEFLNDEWRNHRGVFAVIVTFCYR